VYLVGGGTHPGSGLPVIFESARISSKLVLQDFGMSQPTQQRDASQTSAASPASVYEIANR